MTHTSSPSKPITINSALRHQCRYVIQFKITIMLLTTFHSVRVTNKPQSLSNAAYNFPGTHSSYSATALGIERHNRLGRTAFLGSLVQPTFSNCQNFLFPHFQCRVFQCHVFYCRATSASPQHSTLHLYEPPETHYDCEMCTACIFTVNFSALAAQQRSQVKWMTPVKPEKNTCLASTLFQCVFIRSDAADAAADHKATPPPLMKNARRAAAAGHKTTQRRRRPPVRRRTALRSS